jgi:peroxiredoxin
MRKLIHSSALIAVIALSAVWAGLKLYGQRAPRPVAGSFHRSKVDGFGHTRGIIQVDLMRQIMAERARSTTPAILPGGEAGHHVPSQDHPLLGRPAPSIVLEDERGNTWSLGAEVSEGPVVVVFYLGHTCMACVTHLTELDVAMSHFRERGARVLAVSGDAPEFSQDRLHKYGDLQIPLLSDRDRAASLAYGVWKAAPRGDRDDGEALHGTFIVNRDGLVCWAYVGNRPFTDIEALLAQLDGLKAPSSQQSPAASQ